MPGLHPHHSAICSQLRGTPTGGNPASSLTSSTDSSASSTAISSADGQSSLGLVDLFEHMVCVSGYLFVHRPSHRHPQTAHNQGKQ